MMTSETIIRRPIFLTEKSNTLRAQNQVVFEDPDQDGRAEALQRQG
jgi:ribosomal protein L23